MYTRKLGTNGYGKLALIDTVLGFVATVTIISIYSGYIRFYREYEENKRQRLRNTAINFALLMTLLDILLVIFFGKYISYKIFNMDNSNKILILVVLRSIFSQFIVLLISDYTLNYEAHKVVIINLINLIFNLTFVIFFVVFKNEEVIGIYKGYVYSDFIVLVLLVMISMKNYKVEIDIKMLKKMLIFSGGLIPSNIAATVLTLSDRYFLKDYKGFSETGIYSIGYKFGTLIEPLFVSPFNKIFTPYKFEIWKDDDAEEKFNNIFLKYHFVGCFIILGVAIFSKCLITLFTTVEYIDSYKIIPLVLVSYFLYGKSSFYCLGMQIKNKTYLHGFIMLISGVINICLNILLIPMWGMYGAAFATIISYIIINFLYLKISLPLYHIKYRFKKVFKIYILSLIIYGAYYYTSILELKLFYEFIFGCIFLFSYFIGSYFLGIITKKELKAFISTYINKS